MEIINNQYRYIETLYTHPRYSTILVLDEADQNLYQLIVPTGPLPQPFVEYMKKNLLKLFFMDHTYIIRHNGIGRIFSIDNVPSISSRFFFVSEYLEPQVDFADRIANMSFPQKLDICIALCRCLNYVHANGFAYGGFVGENLVITFDGRQLTVKINDFIGLKLKNYLELTSTVKKANLSPEKILAGGQKEDMLSLGVLMLSLVLGRAVQDQVKNELKELEKRFENSDSDEAKLMPIISKLLEVSKDGQYYPYQVLDEIASLYNMELDVTLPDQEAPQLFCPIVSRQDEINRIIKFYETSKMGLERNIILIEGDKGTGKSALGIAVSAHLRFQDTHTFSFYYRKNHTPDENWKSFIAIFKHFSESMGISDFNSQLNELSERYSEYELKREELKCVFSCLNHVPSQISILIKIDDIHYADDFFLRSMVYIAKELNIFLLLTYNAKLLPSQDSSDSMLHSIVNGDEYKKLHIKNISAEQVLLFLQSALEFSEVPNQLVEHIFLVSSGNPQIIVDELASLIKAKKIVQNKKTGFWEYDAHQKVKESEKDIFLNSILHNNIESQSYKSGRQILEWISLFKYGVQEKWLYKLILDASDFSETLDLLYRNMILSQENIDGEIYYKYSGVIIQDAVYKEIPEEQRFKMHLKIINIISKKPTPQVYNELIHQNSKVNDKIAARRACLRLAYISKKNGNITKVISYLKQALSFTSSSEYLHTAKISCDLAYMFYELGEQSKALTYAKKAIACEPYIKNECLISEIYIVLLYIYDYISDIEKCNETYKKVQERQKKYYFKKIEAQRIRIDGIFAYCANDHVLACKCAKKALEIVEGIPSCRNIVVNLLRLAATSHYILGDVKLSEGYLKQAKQVANEINFVRAKLWIDLSISKIYLDVHRDFAQAYSICALVEEESKQNNLSSTEMAAVDYLAHIYMEKGDFENAYEKSIYGLQRSKEINYIENVTVLMSMLISICTNLYKFDEAYYFYKEATSLLERNSFGHILPDFYTFVSDFQQKMGDVKAARNSYKLFNQANGHGEFFLLDCKIKGATVELLSNAKGAEEKALTELANLTDTRLQIENCLKIFIELIRKNSPNAKKLYEMALSFETKDLTTYQLASVYYIRSFYEKEDKIYLLRQAHYNLLISRDPLLRIFCYIELAKAYVEQKEYDVAKIYYANAAFKTKAVLANINKKFKYSFFCRHMLYVPFYNLKKLLENDIAGLYLSSKRNDKLIPESEFASYLKVTTKNIKISDGSEDLLVLNKQIPELHNDILFSVNRGAQLDIDTLLQKISLKLLATNACVFTMDEDLRAKMISSLLPDEDVWNSGILDGIYVSSELSILEKKRIQNLVPHSCIDTSLLMPIFVTDINQITNEIKQNIIGYLYAESYLETNRLKKLAPQIMQDYGPLLGLLLNKLLLENQINTDALTRALSRKSFNEAIKNLQTAMNKTASFLYYDLDSFKSINDTYGHRAGDLVLATVAQVVMSKLEGAEKLYRYGGEEFVAILPNANSKTAFEKAEIIRKAVETTSFSGYAFNITMSIGISTYGEHSTHMADLIPMADAAMFFSKRTGKNKTTIWTTGIEQLHVQRDALSRTIGMDRFWSVSTASLCVDMLKAFQNAPKGNETIKAFLQRIVKTSNAMKVVLVLVDDKQDITSVYTDDRTNNVENEPWKEVLYDFAKAKNSETSVLPIYTNPDDVFYVNYILCVPLVFKGKHLGAMFSFSARKKNFSQEDISLLVFLSTLLSPFCE